MITYEFFFINKIVTAIIKELYHYCVGFYVSVFRKLDKFEN